MKNYRKKTIVEVKKSMKRQNYGGMIKIVKKKIVVETSVVCFIFFILFRFFDLIQKHVLRPPKKKLPLTVDFILQFFVIFKFFEFL